MDSASTSKVLIPTPPEFSDILVDQSLYSVQFRGPKSDAALHPYRVQPELGFGVVTLHVYVAWLLPVVGIEEEPIWTDSHHRRHFNVLLLQRGYHDRF
jgi:hypothetical protein